MARWSTISEQGNHRHYDFVADAAPLWVTLSMHPINHTPYGPLWANVTSSTKPEAHHVLHCHQRRPKPRPQVTCTENLVGLDMSFFRYASGQTNRETDILVTVFASLLGVKLVGWSLASLFSTNTAISETRVWSNNHTPVYQPFVQDSLGKPAPESLNQSGFWWSKRWWEGSGISWTICKSFVPCFRQITTPAPEAECSSWHPTNSVKPLKSEVIISSFKIHWIRTIQQINWFFSLRLFVDTVVGKQDGHLILLQRYSISSS